MAFQFVEAASNSVDALKRSLRRLSRHVRTVVRERNGNPTSCPGRALGAEWIRHVQVAPDGSAANAQRIAFLCVDGSRAFANYF
jgi:hypothetical protein